MEKVAKVKDIKEKLCVTINGKALALFKIRGKIYCTDSECSHASGPLCEGKLDKTTITCPWHGSEFDITTGKVKHGPAVKGVKSYNVTVKDDYILIDI